jgi:hypothetical protein
MSAHPDAATEAGCVLNLFARPDIDRVSNLSSIASAGGKCSARKGDDENQDGAQQSQTAKIVSHAASSRKLAQNTNYGTGNDCRAIFVRPVNLVVRFALGRRDLSLRGLR